MHTISSVFNLQVQWLQPLHIEYYFYIEDKTFVPLNIGILLRATGTYTNVPFQNLFSKKLIIQAFFERLHLY
jgi:hypothetical protein